MRSDKNRRAPSKNKPSGRRARPRTRAEMERRVRVPRDEMERRIRVIRDEDYRAEQQVRRKKKKRRMEPKPMTDRKKALVRFRNKVIILLYVIFAVYRIISFFSWKSIAIPMMKNESTVVVDINGNEVEKIGGERIKQNVSLSDIPQDLKDAYIDIEDERFYKHRGVDIKRTVAAIGTYITHGGKSSFGGSTITQQLVKNITGEDDNSISRKVGEWIKAFELESFSSKDEILESYMNIIYTGPNIYGVQMGAKYYFNKDVKDLSLAECAYIAGINISPNSYNPFGENDNSERIKKRVKTVLGKMHEKGDITDDEYNQAIQEAENGLNFQKGDVSPESDGVYSYYTDAVVDEVVSDISKEKHISKKLASNYVYMSGLTIHSNEDSEIQKKMEKEYNSNSYKLTSASGQKSQSAMVVIDHTTGEVRGVVGGLGEKTTSRGLNRATQSYRQTGSAIKPIAVLVPGIDGKIFTPATIYGDEPTTFEGDYSPKDNDAYIGDITVRRAVESSQNIPFVKMMEQIKPANSIKYLKKMGITSLSEKDESLALALGGEDKGITPLEMAGAYATIANDGIYIEPSFYRDVVGSDGKTVIKKKQKKTKVFSKEVAYVVKELVKQPVEGSHGTARGCRIDGMDVAAKTGTTNENYDKWLCGFTPYYTAVTWYGYDTNESISYSGTSPAARIWSSVMKSVHSDLPSAKFVKPSAVKEATICDKTGMLSNSKCYPTHTEYFLPGTIPTKCIECTGSNNNSNSIPKDTNNSSNSEPAKQPDEPSVNVTTTQSNTQNSNNSNTSTNTNTNSNSSNTNSASNNTTNSTTNNSTNSGSQSNQTSNNQQQNTNNNTNEDDGLVDDGQEDNGP